MFAKFIINCLQELGVYNFWTVKVLIQAETSVKPRGKLERERKNHIYVSLSSNLAFEIFWFQK